MREKLIAHWALLLFIAFSQSAAASESQDVRLVGVLPFMQPHELIETVGPLINITQERLGSRLLLQTRRSPGLFQKALVDSVFDIAVADVSMAVPVIKSGKYDVISGIQAEDSIIIAGRGSGKEFESLSQLNGKIVSYSDSHVRHQAEASMPKDGLDFEVLQTASYRACVDMVRRRKTDYCIIDPFSFGRYIKARPGVDVRPAHTFGSLRYAVILIKHSEPVEVREKILSSLKDYCSTEPGEMFFSFFPHALCFTEMDNESYLEEANRYTELGKENLH